jgi:ribosomal-protein-alanine N-acetyltransferase
MISGGEAAGGNETITVRRMSPADVTDVLVILHESPEAAMWTAESLMEAASSGAAWIAEANGQDVAFLIGRAVADEFEVLNLAVTPAQRRRGIALRLMNEALRHARTSGANRAYLEVRSSNKAAIALYSRFSFTEWGRRPGYYQYPVEDALVLAFDLK